MIKNLGARLCPKKFCFKTKYFIRYIKEITTYYIQHTLTKRIIAISLKPFMILKGNILRNVCTLVFHVVDKNVLWLQVM